ncbi:Hypothetical predicted protein [Mytilus galloprovincialis]|uniref:WSC domain-containing protein n=1 Tax=Mytilus galloprovincialis TaxID=29158 RepID=A0A8B6CAU7_MYTGA|nr:Hypothetical predicted protein [Mytilus galloprovincialis]
MLTTIVSETNNGSEAYVGCFSDDESRLYDYPNPSWNQPDQTIDKCMRFCKSRNFIYSGLEFKTHCFCGSDDPRKISGYFKQSEKDCTLPCGGQSRESCGGPWRLSIYKGNQKDLGTTSYKSDSSSRYPQPIYENDTATIFVQESLQNGERICVTFRVQAGGYFVSKDLTTHAERQVPYDKTETYHTLCYIYDGIPPKHCTESHSCKSEPLKLSRRISSSRNITVQFQGWMDPNMDIGSGIESYEIAVYEVKHISSMIQIRDTKIIHILNIYPSDNRTSVNIELPPKTSMLYAVLLTVKDKANNIRQARRFVLYDNISVIVVSPDNSFNITEVMNHNNSSQLCISWLKRFYNNKLKFNNFLVPIRPETAINGIYDQMVGLLPIDGTENTNGLTAFYFTFIRNNENVYTGRLQVISHQSVCLTSEIKHDDIITFHLKVEDIMNHTLNDSVTVYIKHITEKKATATDRYKETYDSPGTRERQSNVYDDVSPAASNSIYESIRLKPKSTIHEIFDKENGIKRYSKIYISW